MRVTAFVAMSRFIGSFGFGAYVGAAVAGLVAVFTGRAFAADSPWPQAVPVLVITGALITAVAFRVTRPWLLPKVRTNRWLWGAAAGAVLGPLAVAVGQLGSLLPPVALPLMLVGSLTTMVMWARRYRNRKPVARPRANYAPQRASRTS